ncbi:MAG: hypothetical protein JO247_12410 [Chloroflexi bacterium]|nr:hypothetical protein [Chloroflexota bacterium]
MPNEMQSQDQDHKHERIEVRTVCAECGQELGHQTFNRADIEQQQMSELPDREAMSLINADIAAPINAALALNVLSDGSVAQAVATQNAPITQTT